MTELQNLPDPGSDQEPERFPVEPRYHPVNRVARCIYEFLASSRLALFLLVSILLCCLAGVTVYREQRASEVIFGALWFNGLLVLLVVNVACCFFGRIWGRRVTLISFGMILFHLSFVAVFLGIVFNSLFYFRGVVRLTEGESLSLGNARSFDAVEKGRFFDYSRLKGDVTLVKMHTGYRVNGDDKRAAYEVEVGPEGNRRRGMIYVTHRLSHNGLDYFNEKEGYSILVVSSDGQGRDLYGGFFPLQSIRQKDGTFQYTTGFSKNSNVVADVFPFPAPPEKPAIALLVSYQPSKLQERSGEVAFKAYGLDEEGKPKYDTVLADGKVAIGKGLAVNGFTLSAREVRYWVGMMVRYEPGKPIVLASLWVGLAGMVITTVGRMMRRRK